MKIKRIFGLASIASLAVLMTACGKTKKNDTIFDEKLFSLMDQDKADYKKENESKKKAVMVFENEEVYRHTNEIYITEDLSNYYVYNLELEDKKILTIEKTGVDNVEINTTRSLIIVRYEENANGHYGYEAFLFNGKQVFNKVYCLSNLSSTSRELSPFDISEFERIKVKEYAITYNGEETGTVTEYYYLVEHTTYESGINSTKKTEKEYYTSSEYLEKYDNIENFEADGKIYGLKGYTVKQSGSTYYIFKKGKFVNKIELGDNASFVVSNGYALVQTYYEVSSSDDYDVNLMGKYVKVSTYKMCLKNSKITELKNFHYYFVPVATVYNEGVIESWICQVLDFKAHKQATYNDLRIGLVKGNGKVEVNESTNYSGTLLLNDNSTYYSYTLTDAHSAAQEKTVIYNKKGDVTGAYNGIYYDDVLVTFSGDTARFTDKDGNLKAILNSCTRKSLSLYTGTDILGNKALVEIKDGNVTIVDVTDYYNGYGDFYTKLDGSYEEFYTLDSTLTKMDYICPTSNNFEYVATFNGVKYYIEESSTGSTVLYFE